MTESVAFDTPLVLDIGTGMVKAGFSPEESPRAVFPNIVKRPHYTGVMIGMGARDAYVGDEMATRRNILVAKYPVVKALVANWDDVEKIYHHTFYNELRVAPEEHPILMSEPPNNPKEQREKNLQIMFETFNCPLFYLAVQQVLGLIASQKTTGIVIDCGHGVTNIVPCYECQTIYHAVSTLSDIAGNELIDYMTQLLSAKGYSFTTTAEREIVRDIKEKLGYVALDYQQELAIAQRGIAADTSYFSELMADSYLSLLPKEVLGQIAARIRRAEIRRTYELPDGNVIDSITSERFQCPEALFSPSLFGSESKGIHTLCYDSIMKLDPELRQTMCENIVLTGGSTMFPGMAERLTKELSQLFPNYRAKVTAPPDRRYSNWVGGSYLASDPSFQTAWITKQQYDEEGLRCVHRKCF